MMRMVIQVVREIVTTMIEIGSWDIDGDYYSVCDGDCRDDDALITPRTDNDGDDFVYCDDCDDSDSFYFYRENAYMDSTTAVYVG